MKVLAAADEELIGKTVKKGDLHFTVKESFYKGELVNEEQLTVLFEQCDSMNLVGEKTIALAIQKGYVKEEHVLQLEEIKHVQVYKVM
jgi:uncharacterized protein